MSRKGKLPFVEERLKNRIAKLNETNTKKPVKTWSRASTIYPDFVGHTIAVYNGRKQNLTEQWGDNWISSRVEEPHSLYIKHT